MKKYLIILLMVLLPLTADAKINLNILGSKVDEATAAQHLKFKGTPMVGSYTKFAQNLTKNDRNIRIVSKDKTCVRLIDDFIGFENVDIQVYPSYVSKKVTHVKVFVPAGKQWQVVLRTYEEVKSYYVEKYGQQTKLVEEGPGEDPGQELQKGDCYYLSQWETEVGSIEIRVVYNDSESSFYVCIGYFDTDYHSELLDQI